MTKNKRKSQIDPNSIKTRDHAMVAIINGATKSGTFKDRRKEANRKACRDRRNWD